MKLMVNTKKISGVLFFAFLQCVAMPVSSCAMEFRLAHNPEEKISIIIGEGSIVDGDAARLEARIPKAARDKYGNIPLYLNSPGGSVAAAFAIVEVMDGHEFSAFVSSNAICASACASIVYISARFHQIMGTGRLGIHTCYFQGNSRAAPEPSSFCNDLIAQNAVQHGTSFAALNMWQRDFSPETVAWLDKDVACKYGLCGPPGFDDTLAIPSFDCRTAKQESEIAICSNRRLARHEASLAKLYFKMINGLPPEEKEKLRMQQRAWLKYRDSCKGADIVSCLLARMTERHNEIMRVRLQP
jgi:uncharacterized protein YecT (DUF1311 family)/ATP-dependent protease ClpP protease subunit